MDRPPPDMVCLFEDQEPYIAVVAMTKLLDLVSPLLPRETRFTTPHNNQQYKESVQQTWTSGNQMVEILVRRNKTS